MTTWTKGNRPTDTYEQLVANRYNQWKTTTIQEYVLHSFPYSISGSDLLDLIANIYTDTGTTVNLKTSNGGYINAKVYKITDYYKPLDTMPVLFVNKDNSFEIVNKNKIGNFFQPITDIVLKDGCVATKPKYDDYLKENYYYLVEYDNNKVALLKKELDSSNIFVSNFIVNYKDGQTKKIYQELQPDVTGSYIKEQYSYNTSVATWIRNTTIKLENFDSFISNLGFNAYDKTKTYENAGTISIYGNTYVKPDGNYLYLNSGKFSLSYTIIDDTTYQYQLKEKPSAQYKVYVGQDVGNDFLTSFQVTKTRMNEFRPSETTILYSNLDKGSLSYTKLSQSDNSFAFKYLAEGNEISKNITTHLVKLGTNKFDNITYKKYYMAGEIFNTNNIDPKQQGSLTYEDGTTISLNSPILEYNDKPITTCELGSGKDIQLAKDTKTPFNVSYLLNLKYFESLEYKYQAEIKGSLEDEFVRAELVSTKDDYKYNEVLEFGSNAKIHCYDESGNITKTILAVDFNSFVSKDEKYGKKFDINSGLLNEPQPIVLTNYIYNNKGKVAITQSVTYSYAKTLNIDTSQLVRTKYIIGQDFVDFNYEGLKLSIVYNERGVDKTISVQPTSITHEEIDVDNVKSRYTINVQVNYENRILTGSFIVYAEKKKPIRLDLSKEHTEHDYYNNNLDKFVIPEDITFSLEWNDGTKTNVNKTTDLIFYKSLDFIPKNVLSVGSIIKTSDFIDGELIYVKHKEYDLYSKYSFDFKADKIVGVELTNNVSFVLGNYYNESLRPLLKIKAKYESGLQSIDNFNDYSFKNNNMVLNAEPVIINYGDNSAELDMTKITFVKPSISKIDIIKPNFVEIYNNTNDTINVTNIKLEVSYEKSKYKQIAYDYVSLTVNQEKEFSVTCELLPKYVFDGTQKVDIKLEGVSEKTTNLVFNVINRFNAEDLINNTISLPIKFVAIQNITGIKLNKAYTEYNINDTFLNDNDDSEITIFYEDSAKAKKEMKVKLNSSFSGINVYPLKGTKFLKPDNSIDVIVNAANNSSIYVKYSISVKPKYNYSNEKQTQLRVIKANYKLPNENEATQRYIIVEEKYTTIINGKRVLADNTTLEKIKVYGYLDSVGDTTKNAHIIFFDDYIPPIVGQSNIKVKFPCYVVGNADFIDKCHFGKLFGNNNAKNRLFVSGNPDIKNCDWHSGPVNVAKQEGDNVEANGDFTYFEDTSYCYYGQTDNEIVGYEIISNDKMAVLKSASDKEPTIYYRTNGLIQAIDGGGNSQVGLNNKTLYEESYPLVVGNIGIGGINNKLVTSFNGDTLFLGQDKLLYGLDITGMIGDSQRNAYTRSYYLNQYIKNKDISKSFLWTDNTYLYIVYNDEMFLTHFEMYNKEQRQYEWWKLDIKDVSCMISYNDTTYFATNSGSFYKLRNGIYKDIDRIFVGINGASFAQKDDQFDTITINEKIINQLDPKKENHFKMIANENDDKSYLYSQLAVMKNERTGDVDVYIDYERNCLELVGLINSKQDTTRMAELENALNSNDIYYINHIENQSDIAVNKPTDLSKYYRQYKLKLVDDFVVGKNTSYQLISVSDGSIQDLSALSRAALVRKLDKEYNIIDIDKENCTFKIAEKGKVINLVKYGDSEYVDGFKAEIKVYEDVKAYFINAPLTLGGLDTRKTIWSWTLTNDTNISSTVEVGYATNQADFDKMVGVMSFGKKDFGYSYQNVDFASVSYDKFVIPHKYTFYRPLSVPFICFAFRNISGENSVLSRLEVSYTIPMKGYGGF